MSGGKTPNKGAAIKSLSATKKGNKSAKPKFDFGEIDSDLDDAYSSQKEGDENKEPTTDSRCQSVDRYKEKLHPEGQDIWLPAYKYPPDYRMRGSRSLTPRVDGEDPAADALFEGARERQERKVLRDVNAHVSALSANLKNALAKTNSTLERLAAKRTERKEGEEDTTDSPSESAGSRK